MILNYLQSFHHFLALWCIFPLVLTLGLYLSFRLKFIQFTKLKDGFKQLLKKDTDEEGEISHFEALSAVLAGNLGTGNISGMAVALTMGGPGSVVWMWVMAVLGAILKYSGCFLSLKYREKNEDGEHVGGPMYYLSKGLKLPKIAALFSIFAIFSAFTVGNLVQVNSMTLPLTRLGIPEIAIIIALVFFVAIVLLGGLHRLARVVSTVVPAMTCIYIGSSFVILYLFKAKILSAFSLIFQSAFDYRSLVGAGAGFGIAKAISIGFERGIFATDAGCGIAPILQSGTKSKSPITEGIIGMIAPLVVMIICTITALVLIVTGAWQTSGEISTNMCTWAFQHGLSHVVGKYIVIFSLVLFAFTTIITWAYCGEKASEYLFSKKSIKVFKYIYIFVLPLGTFFHTQMVWILADISIGFMLITNLIGVIGFSSKIIQETNLSLENS